eukprot:364062-Chlamydomonas_euryale.AAC.8
MQHAQRHHHAQYARRLALGPCRASGCSVSNHKSSPSVPARWSQHATRPVAALLLTLHRARQAMHGTPQTCARCSSRRLAAACHRFEHLRPTLTPVPRGRRDALGGVVHGAPTGGHSTAEQADGLERRCLGGSARAEIPTAATGVGVGGCAWVSAHISARTLATDSSCTTVYSENVEVPMKCHTGLPSTLKRDFESAFITPLPATWNTHSAT